MVRRSAIERCTASLDGSALSDKQAANMAVILKALADHHRLRIVNLLLRADDGVLSVSEMQPALGLSQGTVSHHLKLLLDAGLIERQTRGTYSYFNVVPGVLSSIRQIFSPRGG
jgi:ArsR family transcriptional regulator